MPEALRVAGVEIRVHDELFPQGKEQSQLQILRGVPHRSIPFYFDSVVDGTKRIDISGKLVAEPDQAGLEIRLETMRAGAVPDQDGYQSANWFRSTVHVKPSEIVDVALYRAFSIRIRAKQIR